MKDGDYIGLHTKVIYWLPKNRKYTELEALISHTLDINNGNSYSINGYAKLWQWSRNKVRSFIDNINSEKGHHRDIHQDNDRTSLGQGVLIKINNFPTKEDTDGTFEGQRLDRPLDTTIKKKKKNKFIVPSSEEVLEYCLERANGIDPDIFIDHYEANGWMRGKSKIKSWKACIRTWEKNGNNNGTTKVVQPSEQLNMVDVMNEEMKNR